MAQQSPWQLVSKTQVYSNPWIQVWHEEVIQPNGKPGIYGSVRVNKHGVRIIAVNNEGKLLMNREYRYTIARWGYEFPAGGIEDKQHPLLTAKAELRQETGLEAAKWQKLSTTVPWPSVVDLEDHYFLATETYGEIANGKQEANEAIAESKWLSLAEINALILQGEIFCSETISGLYLYQLYLQSQSAT